MVKKILISITICILIILGIQSNAIAMSHTFYIGATNTTIAAQNFNKGLQIRFNKWDQYNLGKLYDGDLYCVQENAALSEEFLTYEIIDKVSIKGFKSTGLNGSTVTDVRNETMAYILNGKNDATNDGEWNSGKGYDEGKVSMAIWDFTKEWVTNVANKHGISSTFADQTQTNTILATAAKNYSNSITNSEIKDLTVKGNIKTTTVSVNSVNYVKVGPLKWKYGGNLIEVKGYDKNGTAISGIKYAKPNGNDIQVIGMTSIPSDGSDFYILFPSSASTSKISKITAKTDIKIHCADIWFLKAVTYPGQQNMIIRSNQHTENSKIEMSNIEITGDLKIGKFDKNNGNRLDSVEFKIKNYEGKYILKDLFDINTTNNEYTLKSGKTMSYTTNINDAQIFNTGTVKKDITIKNLPIGKYTVVETKNPNTNYKVNQTPKDVVVNATFTNNKDRLINDTYDIATSKESLDKYKKYLEEHRADYATEAEAINGAKNYYINRLYLGILGRSGDSGGISYNRAKFSDFDDTQGIKDVISGLINAPEFTTNNTLNSESATYSYIERLYTQILQRTGKPLSYEVIDHNYMAWYGVSGATIINERETANIKIKKIDSITKRYIENVSFSLKMTTGAKKGLYLSVGSDGKAKYTTNEVQMSTKNIDLVINNAFVGQYEIKEFINPNPGYEKNVNKIIKKGNINDNITIELQNTRKYVNITGVVWEDTFQGNNLKDSGEKLIQGIIVQLMERGNSTPIKEVRTDANGKYTFSNVEIEKIENCYVQFKYNGMYYANIDKTLNNVNGSKAIENSTVRTAFNDKFTTIEYGQANGKNGNTSETLKYKTYKDDESLKNISLIKYADNENASGYPAADVDDLYYIISNTFDAYNGCLDKIKTVDEVKNNGITEISNVNLGLYKREQPNLSLDADVQSLRVGFNSELHTEEYLQRMNNRSGYGDAHEMNPQAKFQTNNKYAGLIYERPIYESDITNGNGKELELHVTYKLGIKNLSTSLDMLVGKISYYFNNKYNKILSYGTEINDDGSIKNGRVIGSANISNATNEYSKAILDVNALVNSQQESYIYIELELNKDELNKIITQSEQIKVDCIAEISSYSVKKSNGTYAGIDINSQPGNLNVEDTLTYEDDTAKAPGLLLIEGESTPSHTELQYYNTNGSTSDVIFKTAENRFTKTGYTFYKWANDSVNGTQVAEGGNAEVFNPAVDSTELTKKMYAIWIPNPDTKYVVNHYVHNLESTTYRLESTENKTGTTDSLLTLSNLKKTIPGYTYEEGFANSGTTTKPTSGAVTTTTIAADGSRIINLYYRPNYLKVQYDMNGGTLSSTHGAKYGTSGSLVTIDSETDIIMGFFGSYVGSVNLTNYTVANGLADYNNPSFMNIVRTGYIAKPRGEWNSQTGYEYAQDGLLYDAFTLASQCGGELDKGDVTITLYVNWKDNVNPEIEIGYEVNYIMRDNKTYTPSTTMAEYLTNSNGTAGGTFAHPFWTKRRQNQAPIPIKIHTNENLEKLECKFTDQNVGKYDSISSSFDTDKANGLGFSIEKENVSGESIVTMNIYPKIRNNINITEDWYIYVKATDKSNNTTYSKAKVKVYSKYAEFVHRAYYNALNKAPDSTGLADWTNILYKGVNGQSVTGTTTGFSTTITDNKKYKAMGIVLRGILMSKEFMDNNYSNEEFVNYVYRTILYRNPDVDGKKYQLDRLASGTSREQLIGEFISSTEAIGYYDSATWGL